MGGRAGIHGVETAPHPHTLFMLPMLCWAAARLAMRLHLRTRTPGLLAPPPLPLIDLFLLHCGAAVPPCSAYGLAPLVEEEVERETAHMRLR